MVHIVIVFCVRMLLVPKMCNFAVFAQVDFGLSTLTIQKMSFLLCSTCSGELKAVAICGCRLNLGFSKFSV